MLTADHCTMDYNNIIVKKTRIAFGNPIKPQELTILINETKGDKTGRPKCQVFCIFRELYDNVLSKPTIGLKSKTTMWSHMSTMARDKRDCLGTIVTNSPTLAKLKEAGVICDTATKVAVFTMHTIIRTLSMMQYNSEIIKTLEQWWNHYKWQPSAIPGTIIMINQDKVGICRCRDQV
jgi:hypothetical protein